jgi:sugar (pentulose or hexulose) kinase
MHPLSENGSRLLRLPAGIPVVGPYIDHEAGYLSAGGPGGRPLQCSLGTAWVGNFVVDGDPPPSPGLDLVLPSPVSEGSLILRVMPAGNVTWDWALDVLVAPRRATALRRADAIFAEALLPPDGLVAFPWFTRPNARDPRLAGNGSLLGLGAHASRADLVRALVAGMTFEFVILFDALRERGVVDRVILGGGASKGWWFRKLLAGLFAPLPVYVAADQEIAGARGCVYAFGRRAGRSGLQRVRCPAKGVHEAIQRHFLRYRNAREELPLMRSSHKVLKRTT